MMGEMLGTMKSCSPGIFRSEYMYIICSGTDSDNMQRSVPCRFRRRGILQQENASN